jgi:uncharacterized protein
LRYLLFAAIVWLLIWYWRRSAQDRTADRQKTEPQVQRMVQCERCGIYLPLGEAHQNGDAYYCSTEHRDASQDGAP